MERKYYLRGLGLGIVVTAVIMGIALSGPRKMTDEEIIQRAKELGMVEDTYLADVGADEEQTQGEQNIEDLDPAELPAVTQEPESQPVKPEEDLEPAGEEELEPAAEELPSVAEPVEIELPETESAAEGPASEETPEENTNEMTRQDDTSSSSVKIETITVVSGDGSYTVARKLKEAGVVMSAETFDTYLCEKGYDKRLRTGTFRIPADASDEQIARIITGQE